MFVRNIEKGKRENHKEKLDFAKFNLDIKTETYILITSEEYKSENSKQMIFYSIVCLTMPFSIVSLFSKSHWLHWRTGSPLRFTINMGGKIHLLQAPSNLGKKTDKEQEHKQISQAEKPPRAMQQVSPLHFQRMSKSSYLPTQEPATSTRSNTH